jgi:hypothetical protein
LGFFIRLLVFKKDNERFSGSGIVSVSSILEFKDTHRHFL